MANEAKCVNCGSDEIDYDPARGDAACVACGAVVQQSLIVNDVAYAEDSRGRSNLVGQQVGADGQPHGASRISGIGRSLGDGASGTQNGAANGEGLRVLNGHSVQATANTMNNARRQIQNLASQLKLSGGHVDQAVRLYRLAVERNFHRGRRVVNLSCACMYVVCRMERTAHMLLDFADVARTNVFTLGHTFLKLVRLLEISLPLVDPSLYMHRFAARLEFGDSHNAVAITALRIAARMQRDWMTQGRRPAGLCGAALLTAAVMHNFFRSQKEVAKVVRIGNVVLRNRLREFDQTSTARMTTAQIEEGGGEDGKSTSLKSASFLGDECLPPAFIRSQEKKKAQEAAAAAATTATTTTSERSGNRNGGDDDDRNSDQEESNGSLATASTVVPGTPDSVSTRSRKRRRRRVAEDDEDDEERRKAIEENERAKQIAADDRVEQLMQDAMASDAMQSLDKDSETADKVTAAGGAEKMSGRINKGKDKSRNGDANDEDERRTEAVAEGDWEPDEEPVELSDLDEDDTAKYISTEEEAKRKEELWIETNKDYLEHQARMEQLKRENPAEYERLRPGAKRKRKSTYNAQRQRNRTPNLTASTNATLSLTSSGLGLTAQQKERRSSKKINYEALQSLEDEDSDEDES